MLLDPLVPEDEMPEKLLLLLLLVAAVVVVVVVVVAEVAAVEAVEVRVVVVEGTEFLVHRPGLAQMPRPTFMTGQEVLCLIVTSFPSSRQ